MCVQGLEAPHGATSIVVVGGGGEKERYVKGEREREKRKMKGEREEFCVCFDFFSLCIVACQC